MAQWINLNRNYRSAVAHRYSALREKTGPLLLPLVGLTAGWLAGWLSGWQTKWGDCEIYKILYRLNYIRIFTSFSIVIMLLAIA